MNEFKPGYCLDIQYAEHAEQIDEALDATRLDNGFDIIKYDELSDQAERESLFAAVQLSDILDCQSVEGFDAVERAVHLALRVTIALAPSGSLNIDLEEIENRFMGDSPREQLFDEVRTYLDDNMHIHQFIRAHLAEIDTSGNYKVEAEAVCGIIFKWADQAIEVAYLDDNFTAS